ncbi:MAG: glycosyltransferase [Chitinivibrionales bacterium]|nr:glycosyltransferase [Chitinivibrionales bacterium]
MITVACFSHRNLVEKELMNAFRRIPDTRVIAIEITVVTSREQAALVCNVLKQHKCTILLTINNWGLDNEGVIADFCVKNHCILINWCVDDPFFHQIINNIDFPPSPNRLDFVSDRGYIKQMTDQGYNAIFLPLATDPSIFHPVPEKRTFKRNTCFVGNSYREQMDKYLKKCDTYIESFLRDIPPLLRKYSADMGYDIESEIEKLVSQREIPSHLSVRKAVFYLKHFIGYLYRKNLVVSLEGIYPDFKVFGDEGWVQDIPAEKVSRGVGYYKNLNLVYQQTRVNLDINRMVIRDGFTQRVFDSLASNSFIITSRKRVVYEYFETEGDKKELVVFRNSEHLQELIDYYLRHETERAAIAERGMKKVLSRHTYDHRVRVILKEIGKIVG